MLDFVLSNEPGKDFPPIFVLAFRIQVFVLPVSNIALMVYGGVPTVISVTYVKSF